MWQQQQNAAPRKGLKARTIKRALKRKMEDWLTTITDEKVRQTAHDNVIITGGSIASMLLGEKINDYDVYFRTKEATIAVAKYYVDQFNTSHPPQDRNGVSFTPIVQEEKLCNLKGKWEDRVGIYIKSAGVVGEETPPYEYYVPQPEAAQVEFAEKLLEVQAPDTDKPRYRPVFMSQNAITLSDQLQLVIRFYGSPDEIHDNYDFVHAMNWWDMKTDHLQLHPEALEALLSRTLKYRGSLYPIASVFRTKKFLKRGWHITAGEQLKMMWQIGEVDFKNPMILREQLTGVDMAYMYQLIELLKHVAPEKINSSYVAAIIDRVFD